MTISAQNGPAEADRLSRTIELYRDLSIALRDRLKLLKENALQDLDCSKSLDAVRAHHKALQTVLDLEGNLAKQQRTGTDGAIRELDLDAARTEIASRLSVWLASRGS
ncbi:hypothetical protein [Rhodobacteraceae bacterium DSL-40]|uniref:hypothetical protein n=1 Tax=Amaricoccus sp. B4 TaxID=3368557 RepID=UPI0013A6EA33